MGQGACPPPGQWPQPLRSHSPALQWPSQGCGPAPQPAHRYVQRARAEAAAAVAALFGGEPYLAVHIRRGADRLHDFCHTACGSAKEQPPRRGRPIHPPARPAGAAPAPAVSSPGLPPASRPAGRPPAALGQPRPPGSSFRLAGPTAHPAALRTCAGVGAALLRLEHLAAHVLPHDRGGGAAHPRGAGAHPNPNPDPNPNPNP